MRLKMKTIFAFLAILIFAALTFPCVKAETTFFDNPNDAFTMGNFPAIDDGTIGGTTDGGNSKVVVNETNQTNETIETNETAVSSEVPIQTTAKPTSPSAPVRLDANAVTGALISIPTIPLSTGVAMLAVFAIIAIAIIFARAARLRTLNTKKIANMLSAVRSDPFLLIIWALSIIFIIALVFQ
jgi:hypothetical protein